MVRLGLVESYKSARIDGDLVALTFRRVTSSASIRTIAAGMRLGDGLRFRRDCIDTTDEEFTVVIAASFQETTDWSWIKQKRYALWYGRLEDYRGSRIIRSMNVPLPVGVVDSGPDVEVVPSEHLR